MVSVSKRAALKFARNYMFIFVFNEMLSYQNLAFELINVYITSLLKKLLNQAIIFFLVKLKSKLIYLWQELNGLTTQQLA